MNDGDSTEIRANTVLPAERRDITLTTADGLTLVGELALPVGRPAVSSLITVHPLPTAGGFMDSHLLRKASYRLPELHDIAVLRFNTRGTSSDHGTSDGVFDEGRGERYDVEAAQRFATDQQLPRPFLVGWSFGSDLALMYGNPDQVEGLVLISPPLRHSQLADLKRWDESGKPVLVLVPELDDYLRPQEARERFAAIRGARVVGVEGAKHLWVGEKYVTRVMQEVVEFVTGGTSVDSV